jgi:phosphoglycerate dehydrogenase-like enzyme
VTYITHPDVPGWDFQKRHADQLCAAIPGLVVHICHSEEEFVAALPEAQIALVWRFRQEWVPHAYSLRLLATPAAGRDYFAVDLPKCVTVAYGQFHGGIMGETVVGMLLAMCRGILPAADRQRSHPWPRAELAQTTRRLRGSHVTILGFGHIGRHIGHLLKPFGVKLTGIRRTSVPPPAFLGSGDRVATLSELDEILPHTDHLVLCLPGVPETDNLLNRHRIGLLPPRATLCNVGRGNALDEEALVEALRSGRLAGACLDVFRTEPLPMDSPLRTCPNLWLMPHASAIAPDYLDLFVDELAQRWHSAEIRLA